MGKRHVECVMSGHVCWNAWLTVVFVEYVFMTSGTHDRTGRPHQSSLVLNSDHCVLHVILRSIP